jgi:hypothetical protein
VREVPPIGWRAVLVGGAVALAVSLLLSIASQALPAVAVGIAVGAAVAGRLAALRSAFHGGLVAVLWIGAEALSEPFRPAPADVVVDLAQTILLDVVRLALGVAFGWLGGLARR